MCDELFRKAASVNVDLDSEEKMYTIKHKKTVQRFLVDLLHCQRQMNSQRFEYD